jgi:prepilin signal peptidase PulO-like enzyme (type II secretory pathway)
VLTTFFAFIYGASLGSFANLVSDRLKVRSIVHGRSECLHCGHKLSWYELVPILSYIYLRGRCKSCGVKLTRVYLYSELLTGILVAILANVVANYTPLYDQQIVLFLFMSIVITISVVITIYDLRHMIVPFEMATILIVLGFIATIMRQYVNGFNLYDFFSGAIVALPFTFLYLVSNGRWVGMGDVIIYAAFGFILGLPIGVTTFFYSIWLGSFVALMLMLIHRKDYSLKSEIPFTPFIILGALIAFYTRSDILSLYEIFK